jgi:membrane protein
VSERAGTKRQRAKSLNLLSKEGLTRIGQTFWYAIKDFFSDDGPEWAAAIAYYSLLSSFPLILAIVSITAFFIDPQRTVNEITNIAGDFIPRGMGELEPIIQGVVDARQTAGLLSILGFLWTGSRIFGTLTKALNIAFDVKEIYAFWQRYLIEVIMLLTAGLLLILALVVDPVLQFVGSALDFLPGAETILYQLIADLIPGFLLALALFLIYRYLPRRRVNWKAALLGALLAALGILLAQPLFVTYVTQFGNYNLIYGSIGIVIILVLWAWIVGVIVLLGGEIVSHVQQILIEGKAPDEIQGRYRTQSSSTKKVGGK